MAMVFQDVGCDEVLKVMFNNDRPAGGNNFTMKLFATNVTPAQTDTAGTYTEASGGGYAAKTLTNGSFTVTVGNDPSDASYAQQTFTFTGPLTTNGTIYGVYIVDADGVLICSEAFSPYTPTLNGDAYKPTLVIQASSGTPA